MSYFPRILAPEDKELDILDIVQDRYWHRIKFNDISPGDRVLVVRTANGTRLIVESVVSKFKHEKGAWVNDLDSPVVSYLDANIFRSGEYRESQSEEPADDVLGS